MITMIYKPLKSEAVTNLKSQLMLKCMNKLRTKRRELLDLKRNQIPITDIVQKTAFETAYQDQSFSSQSPNSQNIENRLSDEEFINLCIQIEEEIRLELEIENANKYLQEEEEYMNYLIEQCENNS